MSTPANPIVAGPAGAVGIIGDIAELAPIGFALVKALVDKLKGQSDADILAADAADWSAIIATAQQQANPSPQS